MKWIKSGLRWRHLLAFLFGVGISYAYVEWGAWGRVPMMNLSQPTAWWARILYWPGLQVGNGVYGHLVPIFRMRVALDLAGIVGMLVMGVCSVLVLEFALLLRRWIKRT